MPTFYADDIDISTDEFLNSCRLTEIEEVIHWLQDNNYLKKYKSFSNERLSYSHEEYLKSIYKLENLYHTLPNEESDLIVNLAKKY